MTSSTDLQFMQDALALARLAAPACRPNPAVGCVLVGADGQLLGRGMTQRPGQAHAEVMALRDARSRGASVAGATAYVTLEPCAHQGRTPPCCDALTEAGIARVVVAVRDPNPRVAGQGLARLRAAGVDVTLGVGATDSRELNLGFFSRMLRGLPWLRVKAAASLDGRTALPNGVSQWITSLQARADGHAWRARADAILTGMGTILGDDPRLDVRGVDLPRQPVLVIADSALRTPLDARLWRVRDRQVLIYTASASPEPAAALRARGAEVVCLPRADPAQADGRQVDLRSLLRDLAARGVGELHVEAGGILGGALWRAGLVDELLLYQAPLLLGEGAGIAQLAPLTTVAQGVALDYVDVARIGPDLRLRARLRGSSRWLHADGAAR
ncbi:MAG: bifunctional diaminohydroxyphosphoribosylaminopyrimidine deaminase/5-amino-6-(5-phosphoribosylamino)uracil reductase RibD [Ottowia sp.]|nr:bifunctional diaminohydroxyphosphoribosylaminopyrimidine deaminase/5-amino-6-(5-phosphoribosylamino)uracil reductase RibD [Ottowia sp.]